MNPYISEELGSVHRESFEAIMRRASIDWDYRQALLENPRQAIEEETGMHIADGFEIKFVENADADMTVVLPDVTNELDDSELDEVAGGSCGWVDVCNTDSDITIVTVVTVVTIVGEDPAAINT